MIGIILALAAILSSAIADGIYSGRNAACASNLQQIYLAMNMYWQDNNGYLPPHPFNNDFHPDSVKPSGAKKYELTETKLFIEDVGPYAKSNAIWYCPLDAHAKEDFGYPRDHLLTSYQGSIRIGIFNGTVFPAQVFNADNPDASTVGPKLAAGNDGYGIVQDIFEGEGTDGSPFESAHGSRINCLFLDGHVHIKTF